MCPVEHRNIPVADAALIKCLRLLRNPLCFLLCRIGKMADRSFPIRKRRNQFFFHPLPVLINQRIRCGQNLRRGTVILHHHDRLRPCKIPVEIQQIAHIGTSPRIDRLIRISHDEQIAVIAAQYLHQTVLQRIDILKFINHDIFQALLPFMSDFLILLENIK